MKLNQLRDFIAVAHAGGIRAAARTLDSTQPALTRSVRELERELGGPLFERTARGTELNAFGKAFLARAERASHELRRASEEVRQLRGSAGGKVSIAVSGTPSLQFVAGALRTFRRRYPQAEVRIVEGVYAALLPELRDGALDFAVVPERARSIGKEFRVEPIFRDERVVVGRRGHPLRTARSLADLLDADWVTTGATGERRVEFEAPFLAHGLAAPRTLVQCEALIALLALVSSSDLLVFLPRQWLESPVTSAVLEAIAVRERIEGFPICVVRREGVTLTPAAESLIEAIVVEAHHRARAIRPAAATRAKKASLRA